MNFPINYDDDEEQRKIHLLFLPNIEAGTKGEELNNNTVGNSIKSNKTALGKTHTVNENVVHKSA